MANKANDVDVAKIAELARLELTAEEVATLQSNIVEILGYVEQLDEVDIEGVEPTAHATAIHNVFRCDEATLSTVRERAFTNAPAIIDDNLIKVPKVIDNGEGGG